MPYLKVQTNLPLDEAAAKSFVAQASRTVAEALGKSERYVMVALQPGVTMLFAGIDAPLAYLELKSIGLPQARTAALSEALCILITKVLGIPGDRIYIEFAEASPKMWGWNGGTF